MKILDKLKSLPFTHSTLCSFLDNYKNKNNKIQQMIKKNELIRIKQSLYILNNKNTSKEILANTIYGPSYISMDYALSFYGLIPERVYEITSITTKIVKNYTTPLGRFTYIKSPLCIYSIGLTIKESADKTYFMIASPEKALCDKLIFTQKLGIKSIKAMLDYLEYDLRIDLDNLKVFDLNIIQYCIQCGYKVKILEILYKVIKNIQGK